MVLIGSKPKIVFVAAHNDMGHFTPSEYTVSGQIHYVTDDMYVKFLHFTDPELLKLEPPDGRNPVDELLNNYKQRIEWALKLNPECSQLWQYNGLALDMKTFIRGIVVFGERGFEVLSLWKVRSQLPVLNLICKILNLTIYFKRRREWAKWEKFLEGVHGK